MEANVGLNMQLMIENYDAGHFHRFPVMSDHRNLCIRHKTIEILEATLEEACLKKGKKQFQLICTLFYEVYVCREVL
jgi:hypothetical protein